MRIRRFGVFSVAKVSAILYAALGLIVGFFFSMIALVIGSIGREMGGPGLGALFGVGAIIIMPIFYGILGFVGGAITAAIYNAIAGFAGGIEIEFEEDRPVYPQTPPPGTAQV